jgi:hypothetical protein
MIGVFSFQAGLKIDNYLLIMAITKIITIGLSILC